MAYRPQKKIPNDFENEGSIYQKHMDLQKDYPNNEMLGQNNETTWAMRKLLTALTLWDSSQGKQ